MRIPSGGELVNNITGLGIEGEARFRLKHGITAEHDALLTMVTDEHGEHFDLIGRSVVLAFRLTGMKVDFPSIVSQREIVEATTKLAYPVNTHTHYM